MTIDIMRDSFSRLSRRDAAGVVSPWSESRSGSPAAREHTETTTDPRRGETRGATPRYVLVTLIVFYLVCAAAMIATPVATASDIFSISSP